MKSTQQKGPTRLRGGCGLRHSAIDTVGARARQCLVVLAFGCGCASRAEDRPVIHAAADLGLEARSAPIRARFLAGKPKERADLRDELKILLKMAETLGDPSEPLLRALLAVSYLEGDSPKAATAIATPLLESSARGVAADLGILVSGTAKRREGKLEEAIIILRPLAGKLLDPYARAILYGELTNALIEKGRSEEALYLIESASRGAGLEELESLREMLKRIGTADLYAFNGFVGSSTHPKEMLKLLADELAHRAAAATPDKSDAGVASEDEPTPKADGGTLALRFDPRAVALLLPMSAPGHGKSSAEVARGFEFALIPKGVPLAPRDATEPSSLTALSPVLGSHRLVVLDTAGSFAGINRALDAADRAGAAFVVGGLLDSEAQILAVLAKNKGLPLLLLREIKLRPASALIPARAEELRLTRLEATRRSGGGAIATLMPFPEPEMRSKPGEELVEFHCDPNMRGAFSFDLLKEKRVAVLAINAEARCAEPFLLDFVKSPLSKGIEIVLGPSAAELATSANFAALTKTVVSLTKIPADEEAKQLRAREGSLSLFHALGRDGASYAKATLTAAYAKEVDKALADMRDVKVEPSASAIRDWRAMVEARVKAAAAGFSAKPSALWTSSSFSTARVLASTGVP